MRPLGRRPRQARSLVGLIAFERCVFECPVCRATRAPADEALGLRHGQRMTRSLVRRVAWLAARRSYGQASADLHELCGLPVSPAECARVALEEGARLDARQRWREQALLAPVVEIGQCLPEPDLACERLVIEADATTVLTVPGEEHKSVWCAKAFGLEHRARKDGSGRPVITDARHAASAVDFEDFGARLKALALRTGLRRARARAFVADGAPPLWRWAEHNLPRGTVLIQDLWHVLEHLSLLAQDLHGPKAWRATFERWRAMVRQSLVGEVLDELRAERARRGRRLRQRLADEIRYLENGKARMDYARYAREGWPLGSGAAEGECKHLVKERFGLTGAHWRRKNIPRPLALRLSIENGEWEQDWREDQALAA
jgi:hypothetical protein